MKRVNVTRLVNRGDDLDELEDDLLHDDVTPLKERRGPKPKRRNDFDRSKRTIDTTPRKD